MITSWFNPNYEGQTFHKILVIGVAQNLEVRADFEDEMAAQIARPGIETIPGNHILLRPDPNVKLDLEYLRGQIRDNHIDAVVVSRLLKVDKKVISIPSSTYIAPYPYYYSFYGYVGAVYPLVYDPGYTREDTTVSVETNVYATSKPDGDLVWNGVSKSFNPKSAKKVVRWPCQRSSEADGERRAATEKSPLELMTTFRSVHIRKQPQPVARLT
jgi:hypothetical protein